MSQRNKSRQIDELWENIFQDFDILKVIEKKGRFEISAKQINAYKEARLMTKFDHKNSLPNIFFDNGLSILPVTRGTYIIGQFDAYSTLKDNRRINSNEVSFPQWIRSINPKEITTESAAIEVAFLSGMIHELLNIDINTISSLVPTISGRMSSGSFCYSLDGVDNNKIPVDVKNSQMEIDAGFESPDSLVLLEAKMHTASTFLVRQLFYPYRAWKNKINKEIIPVYLECSNNFYTFSVFKFNDDKNYNSIELVQKMRFMIGAEEITLNDIIQVSNEVRNCYVKESPDTIFPQANDLNKIVEIIDLLNTSDNEGISKESLTLDLDFVYRQADYYANAGKYLGIFRDNNKMISLTATGREFYGKNYKDRCLLLTKLILQHEIFNEAFCQYQEKGNDFDVGDIFNLIKQRGLLSGYSDATIQRRSQTVLAWIKTIISFINDY